MWPVGRCPIMPFKSMVYPGGGVRCAAVLAMPLRPKAEPAEKPQHAHLATTARLACRALAALMSDAPLPYHAF